MLLSLLAVLLQLQLVAAAATSPIQTTGPAICSQYCSITGCGWTDDYSCPWAPKPGRK
eukprot:SAG11_NODE_32726_length_281_cov_0.851648_1_plen_57_part_10